MRIYEKRLSFVRPNPTFGAKLAIIWENEHFQRGFRAFNAVFVLNPESRFQRETSERLQKPITGICLKRIIP